MNMATRRALRASEALQVLADLQVPQAQQNERSALCLLALCNIGPNDNWSSAGAPLIGITPIMDWVRDRYAKQYAPNSRETFRRQTMHQFLAAGIAIYNPDDPSRPVNSPHAVYQVSPACLDVVRAFGTPGYTVAVSGFLSQSGSLAQRYAQPRNMQLVPLKVSGSQVVDLSPGEHSDLIRAIVEEFGPRFVPGGSLVYAGDAGEKWGHFDRGLLHTLGIEVEGHGKMPDVVVYDASRDWLVLVEAVTSHGPVNPKRHEELAALFASSKAGLVYVSAFPNRRVFSKYLNEISWETEVWLSDDVDHLIHFNGTRFLGPH